jgi:hypothetical protein
MVIIFRSLLFRLRTNGMILERNSHGSRIILSVDMRGTLLLGSLLSNL